MIDTVALREKVLDLAIRGKLVPQDPNDEPASVLLERIRAQRLQMVKEGKLKAKDIKDDSIIFVGEDNLHYEKFADGTVKCIEDEIPFEIPEGWSWERLSNLASFSGGKTPSTSNREYWEGDILWVTSKDMKSKYIDSSLLMISEKGLEQMQLYPENTLLLVTRSGILRHTLPVAILKKPATINQDLKAIMLYVPNLEEYIYICIKGMESRLILEYTKAGATVENINFDAFQKILLPIPPENQIQRIIDATNDTDEVIGKLKIDQDDLIDIISKAKSKILDLAIRGKLVPQNPDDEPASLLLERIKAEKADLIKAGKIKRDKKESVIFKGEDNSYYEKFDNGEVKRLDDELPFDIPESWRWCRLKDLFNVCSAKRVLQSEWKKEGIPFYRAREIVKLSNEGYVDNDLYISLDHFERLQNNYGVPQAGDLMVTGVGTIGKVYIVKSQDVFYYKDASVLCFENCFQSMIPEFAKMLMESTLLQTQIHSQTYGNTVDTITISTANDYLCVLPPLNQQQRIVEFVEKIYTFIESIEKSLA